MKYALLIYGDDSAWVDLSDEEKAELRAEEMPQLDALFEELGEGGSERLGLRARRASTAKVVRVRDGERIVTDGPFAETKEVIGGVFLIDLPDLDEAIRLASLDPDREARLAGDPADRRSDGRAGLPGGVGACGRDPHARPRRPRARRGRGAGRVRDRARALAARRDAAEPGRLDRHDRAEPGDRPDPAGPGLPPEGGAALARLEELPEEEDDVTAIPDERLALVFTCCHPALAAESRVALTLREVGGLTTRRSRTRSSSPSRRWRSGSSARSARSARRASRSACRPTTCCPSGSARCSPCSTSCSTRATPRPRARATCAATSATRRSGSASSSPCSCPTSPRRSGSSRSCSSRTRAAHARVGPDGELVLLEDQDRVALGPKTGSPRGCASSSAPSASRPGPVPAPGRDRGGACGGAAVGRDRRPLRPTGASSTRHPSCGSTARSRSRSPGGSRRASRSSTTLGGLEDYHLLHAARADLLRRLDRRDEAADAYRRALELTAQRGRAPLSRAAATRGRRSASSTASAALAATSTPSTAGAPSSATTGRPSRRANAISASVPQLPPTAITASPDAATARFRACPIPVTTTWSAHGFAPSRRSPGRIAIVVPPADFAPRCAAAMTSPSPPVTTVHPRSARSRPTSSAAASHSAPLPITDTWSRHRGSMTRGATAGAASAAPSGPASATASLEDAREQVAVARDPVENDVHRERRRVEACATSSQRSGVETGAPARGRTE